MEPNYFLPEIFGNSKLGRMKSQPQINRLIIALIVFTAIGSCIKKDEFDFDKLSTDIEWTPEFAVPLGKISVKTGDLLGEDNISFDNGYVMYDNDSIAHIVFNGDKLFDFEFETVVEVGTITTPVTELDPPAALSAAGTYSGLPTNATSTTVSGTIELDAGDLIKLLEISGSTSFDIHFTNDLPLPAILHLSFDNLKNNGIAVQETINIPANGEITHSIELESLMIDFSANYPSNDIEYDVDFIIESTTETFVLDGTEKISFYTTIDGLDISEAKGDFGQQTLQIDPGILDMDISALQDFDGDIEFTDPTMTLVFEQSMLVPFTIDLGLQGISPNGSIRDLAFNDIQPDQITDPNELGVPFVSSFLLTKVNSDIEEFFKNPEFDQINYNPTISLNPDPVDVFTSPNIIRAGSSNDVTMNIDLPLIMKLKNIEFTDTLDDINILQNVESASLYFKAKNGLPFEAELSTLTLLDENDIELASIDVQVIFSSSAIIENSSGHFYVDTTQIASQINKVSLDKAFTSKITENGKIVFGITLNTSLLGTKAVALHSYDQLEMGISVEAKIDTSN